MAAENSETQYPPSSFSGIWKYPTDREVPFRSNVDWLSAKRKDDDIGGLWRVHDKLYNLDEFVKIHPGGPQWLKLTRGTDITEAFETSHVANVSLVEQTLEKYYVAEATQPRISPYTFKPDGFFKVLKKKIEPVMKKVGTGPTDSVVVFMDTLVIHFYLFLYLGSYWDSLIFQALAGCICAFAIIASHNFLHLRNNWRKYYFDLGLISSYDWTISHIFSHHLFPNTVMDIEVTMFEPFFELLPTHPKSVLQRYGPILYSHVLYALFFWIDFFKRFTHIYQGKLKLRNENMIVFFELGLCIFCAPSLWQGVKSWVVIHSVCSFVFLQIGAHGAHHHPNIFHDGDEARQDPDFGLCQLDATKDRSDECFKNLYVIMATFGAHCLHHLFPTICHSKLHHIQPLYEETLLEFKEAYPSMPIWELYCGTFQQYQRTECKKLK